MMIEKIVPDFPWRVIKASSDLLFSRVLAAPLAKLLIERATSWRVWYEVRKIMLLDLDFEY